MHQRELSDYQRRLNVEIWKRMANSGVSITLDYGDSIVEEIYQFAGDCRIFDVLSLPAQFFTAVSWSDYPSKSYLKLLNTIKKLNKPVAEIIDGHGISYRILSKGDCILASGWENPSLIYVDIEDCFGSVPDILRTWHYDDDKNTQLCEAIADYESDLKDELLVLLKNNFDTTPEEIYELLGSSNVVT